MDPQGYRSVPGKNVTFRQLLEYSLGYILEIGTGYDFSTCLLSASGGGTHKSRNYGEYHVCPLTHAEQRTLHNRDIVSGTHLKNKADAACY